MDENIPKRLDALCFNCGFADRFNETLKPEARQKPGIYKGKIDGKYHCNLGGGIDNCRELQVYAMLKKLTEEQ